MDQGPAGLIPSIHQLNAPLPPINSVPAAQPASAVPNPQGSAPDPWLEEQRREHPEQWRQQASAEEDAHLEQLRGEVGWAETAATKFAQGALDALLAPGALVGAGAESLGELYENKALKDFGRGLDEASSGKSAMEAFAGLAGTASENSAYAGAGWGDEVRERLEKQEAARPMLSTLSRMAGMTALALAGGAAAEGESAVAASILANTGEGAAQGAQGAYEHGAPLRDVLSSAAVGGVLGGAISGAAEATQLGVKAIQKRAPDLAKVFGEKVQEFADTRALKAVIDRDRGAWKTFMRGGKERVERVANRIRDSGVLGKGDDAMLEELANQSAKANTELAKLADSFDAAAVVPDISKMDTAIAEQVAALKDTGSYGSDQIARALEREIKPFRKKLAITQPDQFGNEVVVGYRPPTFTELRNFKQGVGGRINWNSTEPLDREMKRLYGTVSDGLSDSADQVGPGFRQAWREANEASSDFLTLKKALEGQLTNRNINRTISPTDYMTSIGAGLMSVIHGANPLAAIATSAAAAVGHKLIREGGSSVVSSLANRFARMTRHVPLVKAGGAEAQEVLQALARTKAFMEDTAARAGANPTIQQAASETAKQVAAEQLAKKAGTFDPVNWHEKPLNPLQKMLYRTQVLDQASSDLSQIAAATNELRPPVPETLDPSRIARLVKDGDATAGIGSLQSITDATAQAAPPTPTGEQAAVTLRKLGIDLARADPAEAMVKTHEAANLLKGAAEYAHDDVSREYAIRAEQALRAELSDPERWGKAGQAYAAMNAAPADFLTLMSKPEAVREALRTGQVMLGDKMREAYMAIHAAHEGARKLTGQSVTAAKEIKDAMRRAEKLFDAADHAVRIDGKPMATIFQAARTSGIYGAENATEAVNSRTVQDHVEQGLEKISPMLKEASGGGYRPGSLAGGLTVAQELTREQYDVRLKALTGAATQPQQAATPGMYAGISPFVGEKLAQLLADMPKPTTSIHGKPFETLSHDDLRLANAMWEATTEPMSVFSDLAAGNLDPDKSAYAWKQYPGLQQAAQVGVLDVLMHDLNEEERGALPDTVLTQVDAALGFGGTLQDANAPDFALRMSKLYMPGPQKPQPGGMLETPMAKPTYTQRIAGEM